MTDDLHATASPLVVRNITQRFKGVTALRNVSLALRAGEIHGLVGANGAGKSTLMRIIAGEIQPTEGYVLRNGARVQLTPASAKTVHGISMVPQHIEFFPHLSVAENVFIDALPLRNGLLDRKNLHERASRLFQQFDLGLDPRTPMDELSFVQQKVVMIIKALQGQASIIILDEPTASLYVHEIEQLFRSIREFNRRGVTFVYISHHLDEIFEVCTRVTVLRDGRIQGTWNASDLDLKQLVFQMVGEDVQGLDRTVSTASAEIVLRVQHLSGTRVLQDVRFDLHKGEILGLLSNKGGGKDELIGQLFGTGAVGKSALECSGQTFTPRSPALCLRHGLYLQPEDRHREGLFLDKRVDENISICALRKCVDRLGFIRVGKENANAASFVSEFSIVTPSMAQQVQFLSGGNQQKVLLSKLLNADPKVLVMDSPTVGVDIKARIDIHRMVRKLASRGISILLVTSDLDEILMLSDRILVLAKGRIAGEIRPGDATFNRVDLGLMMEGGTVHG